MASFSPFSPLGRAVSQGAPSADLLPELHRHVLEAAGARASVVLQRQGGAGAYRASSGRGFADLGGIWLEPAEARDFENRAMDGPFVTALLPQTTLATRLDATEAMVLPLNESGEPAFLLIAGSGFSVGQARELGARAAVEFGLALQLATLARQRAVQQKLQEMLLALSRGVSSTLSFGDSLGVLAQDANTLFGTGRTSVWLHHRRARELRLAGSSDPSEAEATIPLDAPEPPARGLRLDRPEIQTEAGRLILVAPLRGWRRALGTIVIEGPPAELSDAEFVESAYELARQLSGIVENVQLLESVLQQRRLLEDTFNSLVDLVVVLDNDLRVVQTNEAFAARAQTARTALLQRPAGELFGAEMAAWIAPEPATGHLAARTGQFRDPRLDGTFAATITPLINQDGEPVGQVLVIRDITAQTMLEAEQAVLRERLAQSEKLAALGQFVAGIAHEINNPLQSVLGHLELLLTASDEAKPVRATLRQIFQEGDRAAKIVRNLLVFAGSRRMARRPIDLERVVARAIASRRAALRKGKIRAVRHPAGRIAKVSADPLLLQQAFLNIVINAEHAIAAAGRQGTIEAAITELENGIVRTTIRDTGTGIPPTVLPRIFDPFFTTKEVGQGTGLGLAITYGIIQEHGGTVHAANAPEGGAIFTIDLPGVPARS